MGMFGALAPLLMGAVNTGGQALGGLFSWLGNKGRENEARGLFDSLYSDQAGLTRYLQGQGQQAMTDTNRQFDAVGDSIAADYQSRGLGATTGNLAPRLAAERGRSDALGSMRERMAMMMYGAGRDRMNITENKINWLTNGIVTPYPSEGNNLNLMSGLGGSTVGPPSYSTNWAQSILGPAAGGVGAGVGTAGGLAALAPFFSSGAGLSSMGMFFSDRNIKTVIGDVDAEKVAKAVTTMPVSKWVYKDDKNRERHIGPMAQDWNSALGVGNDTTIHMADVLGALLVTIQRQNERIEQLEAKI